MRRTKLGIYCGDGVAVGVAEGVGVGVGIGSPDGISEVCIMNNCFPVVRNARPLLPQRIMLVTSPTTPLIVSVPSWRNVLMSNTFSVRVEPLNWSETR